MVRKFQVLEEDIQHYAAPELSGNIVGMQDEVLRPQTVEEIEALQKQAYDEAKKEGYAEGLKQGQAEMKQEIQQKVRRLQQVFNFLQHPLNEMDEQVEQQLADLTLTLAKQLLKKESQFDVEHILGLIKASLDYLPIKSRGVRVKLNPADVLLLEQSDLNISEQSWSCEADKSITQGGCKIESDISYIDATVEERVQQLVDQLNLHQSSGDTDAAE